MTEGQFKSNSFFKISNSPLFSKFLHDCCDEIIGRKSVDISNYNDDIEWTNEDIDKTKTIIKNFFYKCTINDHFDSPENLSETVLDSLKNCLEIRKQDIEHQLIRTGFLEARHNLVENIDWNLKWILGNSMMPSYKEPILQLHLGCVQKGSEDLTPKQNSINFEMNIKQVDHVIDILEGVLTELSEDNHILNS